MGWYWGGYGLVLGWIGWGWIMRGCRKVQKKCKKMQNYLHMSKKSSTFAPDLGIVPTITLKKIKGMNKTCIFKAQKGNEIWYLYRIPNERASRGCIYRVYCRRKWYDRISWYSYEMALGQLLECCLGLGSVHFGGTEV